MSELLTALVAGAIAIIGAVVTFVTTYLTKKQNETTKNIDQLYIEINDIKKDRYRAYIMCKACGEKNEVTQANLKIEKMED